MGLNFDLKNGCNSKSTGSGCVSKYGCPSDMSPNMTIKRHDNKPAFKVMLEDCDGPFDVQGMVIEANMWSLAKLRDTIDETCDYFRLVGDIGFEQIMVGDIIVMDRVRMPERMLVTAFDEVNKLVKVQRGYHGTTPSPWKKGTVMRNFRIMNAPAESELVFEDVTTVEGTTEKDVLQEAYLVYEWQPEDTCLPGCYWFEFKVIKMIDVVYYLPGGNWTGMTNTYADGFFYTGSTFTESSVRLSYDQVNDKFFLPDTPWAGQYHENDGKTYTGLVQNDGSVLLNQTGLPSDSDVEYNEMSLDISMIPSFTDESLTPYYFGCVIGEGVEWIRRFPTTGEGFLICIGDSHTPEM